MAFKNLYETLDSVKENIGIGGAGTDNELLRYLEAASRAVDRYSHRHFFVKTETRLQTAASHATLLLDEDLLSITTMTTDSELDGTYDGETWVEGTDFTTLPPNTFPKNELQITVFGSKRFTHHPQNVQILGEWGYGDGESASPYVAITATAIVADATTTAITMSADVSSTLETGHTMLVGTEQMTVVSVATNTVTAVRGINGTTATAHASAVTSIAIYPPVVTQVAAWLAGYEFKQRKNQGMQQEKIGDYFYTRLVSDIDDTMRRALGTYQRIEAGTLP